MTEKRGKFFRHIVIYYVIFFISFITANCRIHLWGYFSFLIFVFPLTTDQNFAIGWNRLILRIFGAWPDPNNRNERISTCLALLTAFNLLAVICIPQTASLFKIWPDLFLITENVSTANLPVLTAVIKLFVMCSKKEVLKLLVASIYDDWKLKKSDVEWKTMRLNAEISRKISLYCFSVTMATVVFYFIQQLILNFQGFYGYRRGFYQYYFSFDSVKSPLYEFVCFLQVTAGTLTGLIYTGVVSFFGTLILHLHGQFTILQFNVEKLVSNCDVENPNEFQLQLKFIVERHVFLKRFAAHVEDTFNSVFLLEMIGCSIQLCLQAFIALEAVNSSEGISSIQLLFLAFYFILFLSNLYVICYVGEKLQLSSSELGNSIYNTEWYNLNSREIKDLIIFLQGTKIPIKITAGKFCAFSIQTFAEVIKKSMGYLSVLITVNQNITG